MKHRGLVQTHFLTVHLVLLFIDLHNFLAVTFHIQTRLFGCKYYCNKFWDIKIREQLGAEICQAQSLSLACYARLAATWKGYFVFAKLWNLVTTGLVLISLFTEKCLPLFSGLIKLGNPIKYDKDWGRNKGFVFSSNVFYLGRKKLA